MKEITIYRVRKSFKDIKSQKGTFFLFETAVKTAKKHRLNVYDNNGKALYEYKNPPNGGFNLLLFLS